MDDSLLMTHELDLWLLQLEIVDFGVDLRLHFLCFLLLDLTVFKHFLDHVILMHEHIVLGTSQLNGLADLGIHVLDVCLQVSVTLVHLVLTLLQDLVDESLALDDSVKHFVRCFMG